MIQKRIPTVSLPRLGKVTSYIWLDEKSLLYPEGKTEEGGSKTIYHQIFMDGGEAFPLFEVPVKADGIQKLTDAVS